MMFGIVIPMLFFLSFTTAFAPPLSTLCSRPKNRPYHHHPSLWSCCRQQRIFALASGRKEDDENDPFFNLDADGEMPVVIRGSDNDDIDGSIWEDIETGQPSELLVMKELLGINIFTYILGAFIVFFLSMNYFIGPGWLGSMIGVPGVGTFDEVSESFPDTIDLSSPEFRL